MNRSHAEMQEVARAAMTPEERAVDDRAMIRIALLTMADNNERRAKWRRDQIATIDRRKMIPPPDGWQGRAPSWREQAEEMEYRAKRYRELAAQFGGGS